jgi:hypothetical protein
MKSDAFVRIIAGPVGSGKTTGCIFELLRRACEQAKAPDGIRYTRFAIVRQTLKQLKDTVLKDIMQWLDGICSYKVTDQAITIEFGDVHSEWLLIPLEEEKDQRRLLSMQLTGSWLSETIEMDVNVVSPLVGRCGRYPGANLGGATWSGVIADTNMPTEGSMWHKMMVEPPPDWQVFVQPGGMSKEAENLNWLNQTPITLKLPKDHPERLAQGRVYYERNARNPSPDWVTRYVHAQFGNDPSGTAVHRETFKRGFHVVFEPGDPARGVLPGIRPVVGHPLIIGQDFGRNPCTIIGQVDHMGRLLVLQELVAIDVGLELHVQRGLKPMMMTERFIGRTSYMVGDPAGKQRSTSYEETSFDLLKKNGLFAFPAPTNDIDQRIRAVDSFLLGSANGGPRILIDGHNCPELIKALSGMYRYMKRRNGQSAPTPDKGHPWSDLADALQYLCLVANGGYAGYISNKLERKRASFARNATAPRVSARAWT